MSSPLVDAGELARLLDSASPPVVVDCRYTLGSPEAGEQAYAAGHIPGARYADLERLLSGQAGPDTGRHPLPDPASLAMGLGELGIGDDSDVVVYDEGPGAMAARLWWLLRWLGHDRVRLLDGGLARWTAQGGALTQEVPAPASAGLTPAAGAMPVVTTPELAAQAGRYLLLDARAAARFRGEVEPIDPVAGHVPGAVNVPFSGNLAADGSFLPREELARRYRALLGSRQPGEVVCMCGSGVTACHTLLAMEQAGLGGARLYAGSWSEWIRSPDRPVARGPE